MQSNTSSTQAINLKKLIAAEIGFLGFCLWLACALHTNTEIPLWHQSMVKSVVALLLIATCPLVPVPKLRWTAVRQWLLSGMMILITAVATLLVLMANLEIDTTRDRFVVALLAAATGLISAAYIKRS